VDSAGNLYIADFTNCIRSVPAATGIINTIAGNGNAGFSGDGGPALGAMLNGPVYPTVDSFGNVYFADRLNNRIRQLTPPPVAVSVETNPVGLDLTIDGMVIGTPQTFAWLAGSSHTFFAADQTAASGLRYAFSSWSQSGAASQTVTISGPVTYTANFNLLPPVISCPLGSGPAVIGAVYAVNCTASGGVSPYTWSISTGALPDGMTLNSSTGAITGTPTVIGLYTFIIGTTDSSNPAQTATLSVGFSVVPSQGQTISFGALTNQPVTAAPFALNATASSGLAVSFTSNNTAICTVSGITVTLLAAGSCSITASQPGNSTFAPAPAVTQIFTVVGIAQSITFGSLSDIGFSPVPIPLTAAATSGLVVSFASNTAAVCTVAAAAVTLVNTGTCSVTASQGGNTIYAPATPVTQTFNVNPGSQTINFVQPADANFSLAAIAPPQTVSATATSGLPVSFTSTTTTVCIVSGNIVTLLSTGICALTASQAGNSRYLAAAPIARSFTVRPTVAATITDLGTLGGSYTSSFATGINATGQVVGSSQQGSYGAFHAFLYSAGSMTDLGTLGGYESLAEGISDAGLVAGWSALPSNGPSHAFLYRAGSMMDLGTLGGPTSHAYAINASGQVVGDAFTSAAGIDHAFLFARGSMTDLGTLGGFASYAYGVNSGGQVVGSSYTNGNFGPHAFLYTAGNMMDLGTIGFGSNSDAYGINNAGQVVGQTSITSGDNHAFLYSGGAMKDLGTFGGDSSLASGINNSGQVVGNAYTAGGDQHAFIYANGILTDLNSLLPANSGWELQAATAINDSGQIVGTGSIGNQTHAFLLNLNGLNIITFAPLPNVPAGTGPFALTAIASSGLTVAFTSNTPNVCTVSGNTLTIVASGGCAITATQPGNAAYAPATPVTRNFTVLFNDVSPSSYYASAVDLFAQYGITAGCGNNDFCPDQNVTRAQMAVFIITAIFGSNSFKYSAAPHFADVGTSDFGFKFIQAMYELGITAGCGGGNYCPNDPVTRDSMAVFIIVARFGAGAGFTYPTTPNFTDEPASDSAFKFVQRMKLDGITGGCTATTYCPTAAVTRGQMAVFMMVGLFNQLLPAGTPVVTGISPSTLGVGSSGTFTITGTNTNFVQGTTTLSPIPGVTVGTTTVNSPTNLTVQLTAAANANPQPSSIVAITGAEQDVLPNGLLIQ
jgi:probable HAF family extracellular repeat protein